MIKKKRIACFFTGGYTEVNSMKLFMKKINNNVEYIQLCPIGIRKSKDMIKKRHIDEIKIKHSGLTGNALINYVLEHVRSLQFQEECYDAILIEDDKDNRFLQMTSDGYGCVNKPSWDEFISDIKKQIKAICPQIPIVMFLAAPEVESWFLSDWDNSFGRIYSSILSRRQNQLFSTKFRKYVNDKVLTSIYSGAIESYGLFDGTYRKISEELQNALSSTDFWENCSQVSPVSYSKKIQGEAMLAEIDPQAVAHKCTYFFNTAMLELQIL